MDEANGHDERTKLPFKESHAFIIGINDYFKLPKLRTAVNDAKKLAEVLAREQGFNVFPPLLNASLKDIKQLLEKIIIEKVGQEDRVFFYFAGHGIALDGEDRPEGYIIPVDAVPEDIESFISMKELHEAINKLPCKHLLLVLDCCFSGSFKWSSRFRHIGTFMPKRIFKERFDRFVRDPAWQVITSSAYDQKALDVLQEKPIGKRENDAMKHSPFANALFDALKGKGDVIPADGGDGVITASELYLYIREQVEPQTIEVDATIRQTPGIFPLDKHDKGEYILLHPKHRLNLPPVPHRNPYKGLQSFEEEDMDLFYGRERVIGELIQKVGRSNLLVVIGASGTGKSSVVKAGLVPGLRKKNYNILPVVRPGKTPIAALEKALTGSQFFRGKVSLTKDMDILSGELVSHKSVLVIDQYEELITQCRDEEDRSRFICILRKLLDSNKRNLFKIILTIRADFEPQFESSELEPYWQNARYTVPPFTTEELREIIVKPTIQEVLFIEPPQLVDRIINEVIQAPGALPLLSFTMSELYRLYIKSGRTDRVLHEDDYKKLGGVIGALRTRADNLYYSLDPTHQDTMRKILLRMVSMEGGELAGKKALLEELEFSEEEDVRVKAVIDKLLEARLILRDIDASGQIYVEPAHDALIRAWATLWEWIKLHGEDKILLQNRLDEAVKDYADMNDKSLLWHNDPRLTLLEIELQSRTSWLNKNEVSFVKESIKYRGQKRRRFIVAVISIIIILSGLSTFAVYKAIAAGNEARISRANYLASQAQLLAAEDPTIALQLAEKARELDKNKTTTSTIHKIYRENSFYRIIVNKGNVIQCAVFSADGKYILTAPVSKDDVAHLWDLQGKKIQVFRGDRILWVNSVSFSPDGKYILAGFNDPTARLWDMRGKELQVFKGHEDRVNSVAFSPDGKYILTASDDKTARLWDVRGKELQVFKGHEDRVNSVVFSPDGKYVLTGSNDKTTRLWDLQGKEKQVFRGPESYVESVAFSPDGKHVLAGFMDNTARLWDLQGETLQVFKGHEDVVTSVAFSPDGRNVLTGSWDRTARLWDLQGNELWDFRGHENWVASVTFSPDGKYILTGSSDETSRLWELKGKKLQYFIGHKHGVRSAAFSPDGKHILTGSFDQTARLWDLAGNRTQDFIGHGDSVLSVAFSPDGKYILTGSGDQTARLWDLKGKVLRVFRGHKDCIWSVAFSPDGKYILTGTGMDDQTAHLWDLQGKELQVFKGHEFGIYSAVFSPDGRYILTGSLDQTARLWDLKGKELHSFTGHEEVTSAVFSPDGQYVLTGSWDRTARLWDLRGKELRVFRGHEKNITSVAFSPEGRYILTGSWDNTARLWDLEGNELQVFKGHTLTVYSVAFSPDGKYILTGSNDKTAGLWEIITSGDFLKQRSFENLSEEQKRQYGIEN